MTTKTKASNKTAAKRPAPTAAANSVQQAMRSEQQQMALRNGLGDEWDTINKGQREEIRKTWERIATTVLESPR